MQRGRQIATAAMCAALVLPTAAQARSAPFGSRVLERGARGHDVRVLQRFLTKAGFHTAVDGEFGGGTYRTVRAWEGASRRRVNGRVTRPDARALRRAAARGPADPVPDQPIVPRSAPTMRSPIAGTGGASFVQTEAATLNPDGTATPPASAPDLVKAIIVAANQIHDQPYRYGGGHGRWNDSGYDCSGSVSYALHGAGLLDQALDSSGFMKWGAPGPGAWVTIYAHGGHAFMVVAGLRFDTSGARERGSRWTDQMRVSDGYVVRHPAGL